MVWMVFVEGTEGILTKERNAVAVNVVLELTVSARPNAIAVEPDSENPAAAGSQ